MRACRWSVATALLLLATAVLAPPVEAESERIHITFEAPKRCSDATAFLRGLKKWTKRFELASEPQLVRRFAVTIDRTASTAVGQLEIRAPGAATSLRKVVGKTCEEVAAALALMTALAIDPSAQRSSGPQPADDGDDSSPSLGPDRSSDSHNTVHPASGTTVPSPVMPRVLPTPPQPSATDRPLPVPAPPVPSVDGRDPLLPALLRWSVGFQANASEHVASTRAWGGALFVETTVSGARANPVFRGGLSFSQTQVELPSRAGAKLQWYLASLEGCPTPMATADRRIALYPCLTANVGLLRGRGQGLDVPNATAEVWADLGPTVRSRVGLWRGWSLEGQGTLAFPLRRLSFDVEDAGPDNAATTVFSTPSWGVRVGIGVAYEFR